MAEHPDPFSVNVGSKLLFGAIMLMGLGLIGAILGPLLTAFGPNASPEAIGGAVGPGIMLLIGGVVLGIIAGIFLGYANGKYPPSARRE
ncbi:hypothetical protein LJR016_002107 [Devosia sp. LjRoot16]|uniref:hypothetical protein n=1 Tax=unclassified Devosia TaxID=196773 RepID=UPI0006F99847|nr:hypothetical protein [Devosia sp. Root105]KQU96305.1 hypothetical protein ASC68_13025 [Devosia sp. Root105]